MAFGAAVAARRSAAKAARRVMLRVASSSSAAASVFIYVCSLRLRLRRPFLALARRRWKNPRHSALPHKPLLSSSPY